MADILDQTEVDALLAAMDAQQSCDAPASFGAQAPVTKDVRTYDFKRPERVSKDQIRSLESIHEGFARSLGAALSGLLRTIVEVRVATVEQLTYSEFIHSLPNPTNFNLLSAEPLEGQMCLEISPLIIYPIIDRLLGGSSAALFIPQRPLTMIELRLVGRIIDRALICLTEVWATLVPVTFKLTETESNPHLVQIVAPNEVVVVIGFELKMAQRAGTMSLCVPFNVIEPVMSKLATQGWLAYQRRASAEDNTKNVVDSLRDASVHITVYLAETGITVGELLSLQPGDILQTLKPSHGDLILQVEGKNKFAGRMGKHKGSRALKIIRSAEIGEKL